MENVIYDCAPMSDERREALVKAKWISGLGLGFVADNFISDPTLKRVLLDVGGKQLSDSLSVAAPLFVCE